MDKSINDENEVEPEEKSQNLNNDKPYPEGVCLNCERKLLGSYCYNCGQKSDVKPFTFRTLFTHLYQSLRKVDSEIRETFLALLVRPGDFCREYLAGKRKPYTDPVKYFFFFFIFQISLFGFIRYFSNNPEIDEAAKISTLMQLVILTSVFFWAIAYTLVYRRAGYKLAENTVCMLFVTTQSRIFSVIVQLVLLPFAANFENEALVRSVLSFIIGLVYAVYFSRQFYAVSLLSAILNNLLVLLAFLVMFVPVFFLEIAILTIANLFSKH